MKHKTKQTKKLLTFVWYPDKERNRAIPLWCFEWRSVVVAEQRD